jgi:hypothetical protein
VQNACAALPQGDYFVASRLCYTVALEVFTLIDGLKTMGNKENSLSDRAQALKHMGEQVQKMGWSDRITGGLELAEHVAGLLVDMAAKIDEMEFFVKCLAGLDAPQTAEKRAGEGFQNGHVDNRTHERGGRPIYFEGDGTELDYFLDNLEKPL